MIKKHIRDNYRNLVESDEDFEIFYYRHHVELLLEHFIKWRITAYILMFIIFSLVLLISTPPSKPLNLSGIVISLLFGIILAYFLDKKNLYEKAINIYCDNSKKLYTFSLKYFMLFHNKVISIKDWKKIKATDSEFYNELTTDASFGYCYHYSLGLALFFKDVRLVWCSLYGPLEQCRYAHAFILKDGYLYDSNLRLSYKFEDYAKTTKLEIYKIWSYKEYSIPNFRSSVRDDFTKWCKENNVQSYHSF